MLKLLLSTVIFLTGLIFNVNGQAPERELKSKSNGHLYLKSLGGDKQFGHSFDQAQIDELTNQAGTVSDPGHKDSDDLGSLEIYNLFRHSAQNYDVGDFFNEPTKTGEDSSSASKVEKKSNSDTQPDNENKSDSDPKAAKKSLDNENKVAKKNFLLLELLDEETKQLIIDKELEDYLLSIEHRQKYREREQGKWGNNQRMYGSQYWQSIFMLIVCTIIVAMGLYFAWGQFKADIQRGKDGGINTLKIGKDGIEISSSVIGLCVLAISLAFFHIFVTKVFFIFK